MCVEADYAVAGFEGAEEVGEVVGLGGHGGDGGAGAALVATEEHGGGGGYVGVYVPAELEVHCVAGYKPGYDEDAEGYVACVFVAEVAKDFGNLSEREGIYVSQ